MSEQAPKTSSDEIDLGKLFELIGRAVESIKQGLRNLLEVLLSVLIWIFLFAKKNILFFVLAGGLGFGLGMFLDSRIGDKYVSKMVVEPNFNSAQQLYNNLNFYNELANSKDSVMLSATLRITQGEAASINSFSIDSYSDENQKVRLFDDFIRTLDTTTLKTIDYEEYLKNFNSFDSRFHLITVISSDKKVAKKLQKAMISSISENQYFQLQKRINDDNIKLQEQIIQKQLIEIDSLLILHQKVMLLQAKNPLQGTNINLAENGEASNKEIALLDQRQLLKRELVRLNQEKADTESIVNVISDFPGQGVEHKGIWVELKFLTPIFFITLVLGILLLLEINRAIKFRGENRDQ